MKTRKLQQVGGGTYTVSIPKEWAAEHDFEAGEEVYLTPHSDGTLLVEKSAEHREQFETRTIQLGAKNVGFIASALQKAYRTGLDSVTITTPAALDSADIDRIESAIADLIGMKIERTTASKITARCLLDPADVSIHQALVQLEYVTRQALETMTSGLSGDQPGMAEGTHRKRDAARIAAMIDREFNRSLIAIGEIDALELDRCQLYRYHVTAEKLEKITEIAGEITRIVHDYPIERHSEGGIDLAALAEKSTLAVELAVETILEGGSIETATKAYELYNDIERTVETASYDDLSRYFTEGQKILRVLDRLGELVYAASVIADAEMNA